jgi:hypothetical protein
MVRRRERERQTEKEGHIERLRRWGDTASLFRRFPGFSRSSFC